jgi:hypothetical protein
LGLTDYVLNFQQIELPLLINRFRNLEANHEVVSRSIEGSVAKYRLASETQLDMVFQPGFVNL